MYYYSRSTIIMCETNKWRNQLPKKLPVLVVPCCCWPLNLLQHSSPFLKALRPFVFLWDRSTKEIMMRLFALYQFFACLLFSWTTWVFSYGLSDPFVSRLSWARSLYEDDLSDFVLAAGPCPFFKPYFFLTSFSKAFLDFEVSYTTGAAILKTHHETIGCNSEIPWLYAVQEILANQVRNGTCQTARMYM